MIFGGLESNWQQHLLGLKTSFNEDTLPTPTLRDSGCSMKSWTDLRRALFPSAANATLHTARLLCGVALTLICCKPSLAWFQLLVALVPACQKA